ncbi:MAG: sterol desaturase family protein [Pirellulaceae bacterium]
MNTIVLLEIVASFATTALEWLLGCLLWLVALTPFVALVEYGAHRWIMHKPNHWLDRKGVQLEAHTAHHGGANGGEFVDIPLRNCLLLATPVLLTLAVWGLATGSWRAVVAPTAAMLAWCFLYSFLWSHLHRAIHGVEHNWLARGGPVFRFFRNHHLRHHVNAGVNYGTLFPWTDYLFFTWRRRKPSLATPARAQGVRSHPEGGEASDGDDGRRQPGDARRGRDAGRSIIPDERSG